MKSNAFYAIAAIATLAAAVSTGAQAGEADNFSTATKFESSRSRAEVRAEAAEAVRLGQTAIGEAVSQEPRFTGRRDRAQVQAEAAAAGRAGIERTGTL